MKVLEIMSPTDSRQEVRIGLAIGIGEGNPGDRIKLLGMMTATFTIILTTFTILTTNQRAAMKWNMTAAFHERPKITASLITTANQKVGTVDQLSNQCTANITNHLTIFGRKITYSHR
jgi:hypothetical protein